MLIASILALSVFADDLAAPILKALRAREQSLRLATWHYKIIPPPLNSAAEGEIRLFEDGIAYFPTVPDENPRRVETPTAIWEFAFSANGRLTSLARTKPPSERLGIRWDSAEMQGLAVRGRYEPLSKYLESALAESSGAIVRFTVNETRRQRENHRREYDFESKPPYRLKAFRLFTDDSPAHEFFENLEFAETRERWYVKSAVTGLRSQSDSSANTQLRIEIRDFAPNARGVYLAPLEAHLNDKSIKVVDELRPPSTPKR